ncbi:hypothetical protein [Rhizobium sullae]|uniref:Uncharacterized protein n=1 Tax=Rhizobium sullae TaxID=50338 RepID=A0A4R3PXN5_RHISU|nr:hypothetical protein [Rhizobium sullae]TCU13418.1 hypothetical protein EV132_112116 [Rhizobium sullae]
MKLIKYFQNVTTATDLLMMVAAPMLAPTPADARRASQARPLSPGRRRSLACADTTKKTGFCDVWPR